MTRGEIWTVAGGPDYVGKPRPAVIIQSDAFDATASVTICGITTDPTEAPLFRIPVEPNRSNGLAAPSHVGRLDAADLARLNRALILFLNLTGQ